MAAVGLRFRAELRVRWRAWVALGVLVGVLGGAVLALAAGARRTDTAYRRFLGAHAAYDMIVVREVQGSAYAAATHTTEEIRGLPEVADIASAGYSYVVLGAGYGVLIPAEGLARLGAGETTWGSIQRDLTVGVDRSIHTQAVALGLLALLTAVAGSLVVGQLLARLTVLESDDHPVLAALGMDRPQLVALGLSRSLVVGTVGAAVALALALALSPVFPTGLAATAEPDPGWHVDLPVLGLGALGLLVTVVVLGAGPTWRSAQVAGSARIPAPAGAGSWLSRALVWRGLPVAALAGLRMALTSGRGRGSVPVRASVAAMVVCVVALVAALTFGVSLGHLLDSPRLYGHTWDAELTTYDESLVDQGLPMLEDDRRVAGLAIGSTKEPFEVDGQRVGGLAIDPVKGDLAPRILEGRRPVSVDEIALGTRTMRALGADIGDTVRLGMPGTERERVPVTVVGRAVFPIFSETGRLGEGAYVTQAGGERILRADEFERTVLVRLAPGAEIDDVVDDLDARLGAEGLVFVIGQGKPTDIVNFGRVEETPYLLGGILAALAAATLAHVLVTAIRRRRHELAILTALGFRRAQVRATVAWHASVIVAVALLVGVPLGAVTGRWVWRLFAGNLGVVVEPRVPVLALVVIIVGALVLANLIALVPGTRAARLEPAEALRAE